MQREVYEGLETFVVEKFHSTCGKEKLNKRLQSLK
jgi:hypothetical protein